MYKEYCVASKLNKYMKLSYKVTLDWYQNECRYYEDEYENMQEKRMDYLLRDEDDPFLTKSHNEFMYNRFIRRQ